MTGVDIFSCYLVNIAEPVIDQEGYAIVFIYDLLDFIDDGRNLVELAGNALSYLSQLVDGLARAGDDLFPGFLFCSGYIDSGLICALGYPFNRIFVPLREVIDSAFRSIDIRLRYLCSLVGCCDLSVEAGNFALKLRYFVVQVPSRLLTSF